MIKIEGLDQKSECEYGKQISILLENKTDQWEKIILDGKEQKLEHHKITWKELAPGKHVLHLKAVDQAGNKTDQRITFKITKVLPKAVKQIVVKQDKIPSKKDEKKQKHPLKPERTDQFPHWPDLFHCSHAPSGSCFSPA